MSDFWVFGYGSLIWNPGFSHAEARPAKIYGLHRALCIHSWVHRGTQSRPGLVLGLDQGGSCQGMAFRVLAKRRNEVIAYLRERELVTNVYKESWRQIHLDDGKVVKALTYIVDNAHPQYAGQLDPVLQTEIILSANGKSGPNCEYILKTVEHLGSISIVDRRLEDIAGAIHRSQKLL